jgi:uncharacterized peroxidase-related enzyme
MTARIPAVDRETAPAATRPLLDKLIAAFGKAPNLFATIGQSPAALGGYLAFIETLGMGALNQREIELINVYVSEVNGCGYCLSAHSLLAGKAGLTRDETLAARAGRAATPRESAILALALRIIRTGGGGAGGELARAREAGLSDGEIVEVIGHVASKAFTNAVALVAGTEIDFPRAPHLPQP